MKEQIITFETAKLAKLKGFDMHFELHSDAKCYTPDGTFYDRQLLFQRPKRCKSRGYVAPSQANLQWWLREVHDIHVWLLPAEIDKTYRAYVGHGIKLDLIDSVNTKSFTSYEDALEEGLKAALNEI